jgi:hypothetical protein
MILKTLAKTLIEIVLFLIKFLRVLNILEEVKEFVEFTFHFFLIQVSGGLLIDLGDHFLHFLL